MLSVMVVGVYGKNSTNSVIKAGSSVKEAIEFLLQAAGINRHPQVQFTIFND